MEEQYNEKHQLRLEEDDGGVGNADAGNMVKKLRRDVNKYWMMAHTCSPQYVLGRSALCSAAAILYLLSTSILVEAWLRTRFDKAGSFCGGESDYRWSIVVIFVCQVAAVAVGGIAPVCRWFNAIRFGAHDGEEKWSFNSELKVEAYWTQRLERWKEICFPYYFGNRKLRLIANLVQNRCLDLCIALQCTLVLACKLLRYLSRLPLFCLFQIPRRSRFDDSGSSSQIHLRKFVLHLEGEENLVQLMTTKGCEATEKWINIGKKNRPMHLLHLLQEAPLSKGFRGVIEFDSVEAVKPLGREDPPNCWALPLVTLTAIAMAVPATDPDELRLVKLLRAGVAEGLRYVKLVETNLDARGPVSAREAADVVWQKLDLRHQWLHVKLGRARAGKEAIEELVEEGRRLVDGFVRDSEGGHGIELAQWPVKVVAANSMYRVGKTLLQGHREKVGGVARWALAAAADVMGACLTNLPTVVAMECSCYSIEVREGRVGRAARLLGEVEEILGMVGVEGMEADAMADIDAWRARRGELWS